MLHIADNAVRLYRVEYMRKRTIKLQLTDQWPFRKCTVTMSLKSKLSTTKAVISVKTFNFLVR